MKSNEKGNAPAGAGTPTRAMGNGLATTFPYPDHNTATREKLLISDLLHTGSKNGITLTELVQLTISFFITLHRLPLGRMNGRSAVVFRRSARLES